MDRKRNTKARGRKTLRQKTSIKSQTEMVRDPQSVDISRWLISPPRMIVKLSYRAAGVLLDGALPSASKGWVCNGVYDVDPALGSTATSGFAEWSSLFRVYQVLKTTVKGSVSNIDPNFPVEVAHGFMPNATYQTALFAPTLYRNKDIKPSTMLGSNYGASRYSFKHGMLLENLFDRNAYRGDLTQFRGTSLSNPVTTGTFVLAITDPTGNSLGAGIGYVLDFDFIVEFSFPTTLSI